MRGSFFLSLSLILTLCYEHGLGQAMLQIHPRKPVICYHSSENKPDHIGVSEKFASLRRSGSARVKSAVFEVEYINFPADNLARNAFQYAVDIWQSELTSSIPIIIRAEWKTLDAGVLGQALWGSAYANFGGEQHINVFYPVALAEKITGREINESDNPDIVASFNSNTAWYYGTDGKTPSGKMDLVTIVLHEIAHGLGFTDTYDVDADQGTVGLPSGNVRVPFIFDVFVEDVSEKNLVHDFQTPSEALAQALQSKNLFFNSPLSVASLSGIKPELYAPSSFDGGSSVSHLDEATFNSAGDVNRLMTPQIAFAESIHDPSGVLMAVLSDMGWVYTHIDHEPIKDTERKDGQPFVVTASIRSDNGYDAGTVQLHYTSDGTNFTTIPMTSTGTAGEYEASIPGTTSDLAYAYYISVVDASDRVFTNPGVIHEPGTQPEQGTHFFSIGPDLASPEIVHQAVEYVFEGNSSLSINAQVTDNLGVKEVVVEYFLNDGSIQTKVMEQASGTDDYTATLDLPTLTVGDLIQYRIIATDMAASANVTTLPVEGYFSVVVNGIMPAQDSYTNDFNQTSNDFFGNSFSVMLPDGFANGAIHSDHPYENGAGPNDESSYTYQLQIPIRIGNSNPVIKFDEIVLVEPGESGSVFGDEGFFDYVVVEGSTDGGNTWKPFAPGYDARANSVWLSRYNLDISNDDSQAQGDPGLFRERTINMLENGNFAGGDEVLIRFRLFADQFAHGWGWSIDNLSIQAPVTAREQPVENSFKVYPVPTASSVTVEFLVLPGETLNIWIADLHGKIVYQENLPAPAAGVMRKNIDVDALQAGLYVIKVTYGDKIFSRKIVKVSH
jgi:hypothetical protein